MSTSIIDLPENLQPVTFLQNVEIELPDKSLEIVDLCKEAGRRRDGKLAKQADRDAKRWWTSDGDRFGSAVAFLWLADFYWRNWKSYQRNKSELNNVIDCCNQVKNWILEPVAAPGSLRTGTVSSPAARLIASKTTKAAACYLSGLSYQMLGRVLEASASYHKALELFRGAQGDWQREGNNERARAFDRILEWVERLKRYTYMTRLDPLSGMKLICPWQQGDRKEYLVSELPLTAPVTIDSVGDGTTTAEFLRQRRREWLWIGGAQIDGYKIKAEESLRALDVDGFIKYFTFDQLMVNPETQFDGHLVLPAGTTYYAFQDLPAPSQYKAGDGETTIVFERDLEHRVQVTQVIQPAPRVLGSADYALLSHPSVPPPLKPLRILGAP